MPRFVPALVAAIVFAPAATAQSYIWVEAESATPDAVLRVGSPGHAEYLSGGKWLSAAVEPGDVPEAGVSLGYDLPVEEFGKFELWARVGYEAARSPFRWRIDGGAWAEVGPDRFTTDLMCPADFVGVGWLKLGDVSLPAGTRKLEVHVPRPAAGRFRFGLDCVLATRAPFVPNGPYRPDTDWQTPADKDAAGVTFDFPRPPADDPAARRTLALGGPWQVARFDEPGEVEDRAGPIRDLPDLGRLHWKAIRVPGDKDAERPDLTYCHRLLYRCRVNIPADLAGRSFVLRFPDNALLTTVFVNGKRCGFSDTPCAAFECDVTAGVRPGAVNEVVVGIKDLYYAVARTADGRSCRRLFDYPADRFHAPGPGPTRFVDFPVLNEVRRSGILETPSLTAAGPAYAADVFVVPSVARHELALEVTTRNGTDKPAAVEVRHAVFPLGGEPAEPAVTFPPTRVELPAGGSDVVRVKQPWAEPRLWWPDDPVQYVAETTVLVDGRPADRVRTRFGFHEWGWRGRELTLNGVPWHLRADQRHADRESGRRPLEALREWRRAGQTMFRYRGERPWTGRGQAETLDFFDWAGMPVRRAGIFSGRPARYELTIDGRPHAALFENWRKQLAAWVRAERNHPSVFVWSLETGLTDTNGRDPGLAGVIGAEVRKAAELVRQLDPSRPVTAGDGAPADLPVVNEHVFVNDLRDYPDAAYRPADPPADRPLVIDARPPARPTAVAAVGGEAAFLGPRGAAAGMAALARMLSEGYRWRGVAAFDLGVAGGADAGPDRAWQPVCVLCREWDSTFAAGVKITRTLKVFNDTRSAAPITVHWLFQTKNTRGIKQVRGKRTVHPGPGAAEEFAVTLDVPAAAGRTEAELVLSCERDGVEVFRDVKPCRILPAPAGKVTTAAAGEVALWDPAGKVTGLVTGLTACTEVKSPADLPAGCKLLIIGPDAVPAADAADPKWAALAAKGIRVLAFDQEHPLHGRAVPGGPEPTTHTGRVAFPQDPQHPALAGLSADDFFCWAGDHVVYRNAYRQPDRVARALIECDAGLADAALVECPVGDGVMLLSQLAIGPKPDAPIARAVAANLIRYAWEYKPTARPTVVVLPEDDPRRALLAAAGAKFKSAAAPVDALAAGEVVVLGASPENLQALAAEPDKVKEFTEKGGHLVLWGVTPAGLDDFNRLVGVDHLIRPFRRERVTVPAARPPLISGLSLRDVALESADGSPADDTFTAVVDLDDVAPFVTSDRQAAAWVRMTDGLTSADGPAFALTHDQARDGERPVWAGALPRAEEIVGLSVVVNARDRKITRLRVVFDDDPATALEFDLKPEAEVRQDFDFPPRKCRRIALEPLEWTPAAQPVIGIDTLWLRAKRAADFTDRVVPLLNVGALVYYPNGKGGILLNQVRVSPTEANPENAGKKRALVAALLRNLGVGFGAE